ncbi:glutathione synthase [Candidatus Pelagibacter communis]|uniref:glutathione synthase n=1 Tax=Pelagibacter ubique TaxID=198252 RepID=UPI00094C7490|nr:glutathione synthase [Candidatus Pelagibacter ubique]
MINKIIAIQGDHPSKLNPLTDTTIFLANEIQKKKYKIFYYEPKDLSIINSKIIAKGFFVEFNYKRKIFFKILKKQKMNLSKCKFILIRQDPPFNLEYISTTYILDKIKDKVKIINDPTSIRNISEKLYSAKFYKYMPSTIFTKDIYEIKKFFKQHNQVILKPIHSYSGNNIHLLKRFNFNFIKKFLQNHGHIMCQKYLSKIIYGDKRVFIINGQVCGAISRVPKKGSFLSNMSKGAKAINTNLTTLEIKISKLIAKDLKKEKIFFAGIDFIDQKLNGDINVTSPTGLKTLYDLSEINLAKTFWNKLKI